MGREGPSVQIGAGLASVVGRWLRLSPRRVRDLVPVGAAGALAAAFNTPVAAVSVRARRDHRRHERGAARLDRRRVGRLGRSSSDRILGNEPLFHVPTYHLVHPAELLAYAALGVVGGVVSLSFCKGLLGAARAVPRAAGVDAGRCSRRSAGWSSGRSCIVLAGDHGRRLRVRRSGAQRRPGAQDDGDPVLPEAGRDDRVVRVRQRRRHLRAEPVHRRDGRRRGRHAGAPASRRFRPAIPAPTRSSAWGRSSPASSARR